MLQELTITIVVLTIIVTVIKKHHFQRNLKAKGWMVSFVLSLQAASICWVDRDPITPPAHQHKSYYHKGSFKYQVCGVVTCACEVYSCSPWLGLICVPDEHLCTWYTCLKLVNMCVPDKTNSSQPTILIYPM